MSSPPKVKSNGRKAIEILIVIAIVYLAYLFGIQFPNASRNVKMNNVGGGLN